jgi:hypothetical protein
VQIKSVTPIKSYIVETDDKDWPIYRRAAGSNSWGNLMGESWETCYFEEDELEKAFQEFTN